jgi:DNA-binding transcriptional regulator YdaS (Cro superfamily)
MPTLEEYLNGVQQRQQKTAILESNLGEAANTNPDEFANMVKLSRAAKISVDAVPEYQDLAKSTELLKKTNVPNLVDSHPQTSKFLADPDKAKLASDDIDNFKETESVFGRIGNFFDATGGVIKSGVLSANAGIVGLVRAPIDALNDVAGVILPVRPFTPLTDALAEYQKGISKSAQAALPQAEGDVEKGIVSGGVSLVRNTLNLPLLFAGPNGQRAYFSATLAPVFGEEYGQAKEKGLSTAQAITYGGSQAAIEYATEKIPVSKLIGDLKAGSPFYKTLYNQLLTEIPGEQAATLLQDLNQWAALNPEKPFKTYIEERPSAALQTLVATTVGVGGSTVISTGLEKATNAYADKADAAQRAEGIAGVIENMNKLSAANKVRTRDAETFEEWINQVSEDSPIQNVYINAETLKQSGLDKQLLEVAPDLAGQVETAAAMGRDIQIPISEYMTKIAPTPLGDAMLDNLRAEGETMTRKEAREFVEQKSEELQAAAEQLMVQKENDQKFIDSAKEVETTMFDQLKATGVYTTSASKNFATYVRDIYVTKAAAMNITPSELYAMIPYKITADMPSPDVQLFSQDGQVKLDTDAFKTFYGNSVFKDDQGAPVLLYHGTADDVTAFDVDHPNRKDSGWLGTGVYLTDSTDMAELYAMQKKRTGTAGENVMPLYARLENPYYATAEDKARVKAGGREAADQFTADLQAQGYDGVIYQVAPDAKEIVVFDPAAVKSQFNDGTWSDENNLLSQKAKAQTAGKEVPTTLDELANVDAAFKFAASQTFATNRDFKVALQDRVLSAAKAAKVDLGDFTEAVEQYLVRVALADAVTALETNPNAVGWYNEKVTKALRLVSLIHPEINTDPQAKFAFTWALAVTSNGLKVDKNFELAERAYAAYKETGKMPTNMQAGQAQIAINESLGMFNDLIEKYGFETVEKFMTTKQTVKQVVEFTGKNVSGENLTTEVYGAAALGPKIGNGFFANLYGHFEQLTMDRWLMRTWGRWTGTLLDDNKANIKIKQSQLKSTIQAMSAADKKAFEAIIKTKLATTKLNEVAEAIEKASMKPENRRQMAMIGALDNASRGKLDEIFGAAKKGQLRVSMGDELRKVGNSLAKYMDGQKEAPSGPPERARIRKVMAQALTNLQQQFPSLTMSDLQALLWYPEKRLYDSAKTAEEGATGYEDNEAPDYANAAAALAKEKGVSEETINQTIKDVDNELSAIAAERAAGAERNIRDSVLRQGVGPATVDQRTGLDLNPDGTVTLYHHTSADAAGSIKRSGQLVSAGEPSVYLTTRRETDTGYGDTVVTVRVNPDRLNIDDEFPNGRQDYRIDVGQPGGAAQVLIGDYKTILNQPARGGFDPKSLTTILTKESDYSTFIHETTHFYLDMLTQLANMPNSPQEFQNDLQAVLEWAGATREEWNAWNKEFADTGKMNEGMRKVHEAFAYNSEIYIATGNAPSLKMQTMFDQFAAWLRRVYKSIRDELNVIYRQEHGEDLPILTGEVRQVMDRMLASEEQISQAQTVRGMTPLYQTQEMSGMDDATWAAYQAMSKEAQDQSVSDLTAASLRQMRWLSNAKSRIFKEMQKQNAEIRKEVRAQVAKEIEQQPIYRALRLIKFGEQILEDGTTVKVEQNTKLSVAGMQELYMGEGDKYALLDWSSLGYGKYGMLSDEGVHPDVLAERTGFSSGDELVRSLLNAKTLKEAVEEKTDQRMLEEYSDMSDQRSMDLAVERALHNEARARFVAAELRHAAKATQPVRVMLQAARMAARRIIGNKLVRDTKVSEYSAAETRATRAAEKAMREGKPEEVTKQLQNRLLNNQLTAEATKATQEVDKGIRYLKSVQTDQSRKRVGADYSDQIDQLLSRFDLNNRTLKSIDAQTSLLEWMKSQEDAGYQPEISLTMQNDAYRKNYKNMTVDEFRDLVDAVKQIEHMGRTEQNMLTAAKETAYREARDQIVESINANANGRKVDARTPTTEMGRRLQGMKRFFAAHLKAANVALILDGGKEGAMWEYFIRTANKRGDQETEMRGKATEHLTEIFAPIFKLGKMGGAGLSFPTIGRSLNREARLAIGLNMGNEGNIQRLLDGEGWTREQIQPVLDSLTAQEWQAIQQVWDYFESYRPAIAEKERRIYGKEPKWIDPKPLTVNVGNGETLELRGGYYPVKYDPQATIQAETGDEKEAAKRQLQGAFTSATTRRSFTKARVEKVEGRPLIYTLAGMYSGINDVIHDLAWHEWLIDANKLLRSQSIDQAIRTQYGPEFKQQLKTWVQDVAAGEQAVQNEGEIALNYLRQSISAAGLGFNVMSALQQITGFNQSIVKVGARYIGRGIAQTISDPRDAMKMVNEKSSFMANRARTQFRELNELRNMVQDESAAMRQVRVGAYFMMSKMQRMVDVPTWIGAYEKAIGEGNDESRSIALADQAVIDSQGGGMLKDLSRVERGGAGLKLFTVYYSYMNTVMNLATVKTMTAKSKGRLAADYAMLFVVPVVLTTALKQALTPGGDDEWDMEKLARKLAAEQLSYLMGTMIILREFGQAGQIMFGNEKARDYSGPAGLRVVADAVSFLKQASQLEFDDSFRKAAINLLGDVTGLPSAQINRTITGTKALVEGKTDNPAAIVLGKEK